MFSLIVDLVLISMANLALLSQKNTNLARADRWISEHLPEMKKYIEEISKPGIGASEPPVQVDYCDEMAFVASLLTQSLQQIKQQEMDEELKEELISELMKLQTL